MRDWKEDCVGLRRDVFLAAVAGGMGHLASAFSCIETLDTLYCGGVMRHNPDNPADPLRDRFILSKGHGSLALYAVLCKAGYFDRQALMQFTKPGSALGGEPSLCIPYGIEASTGSLGHGLALGVGIALALQGSDSHVYVLLGDGECQEGSVWESIMTAVKHKLANLTIIIDSNGLQKMDQMEHIIHIDGWKERLEQFGVECTEVDGHNEDELYTAFMNAKDKDGVQAILAKTVKGKGVSLMENDPAWHWRMPNRRERKVFLKELHITEEE